MKKRILSLLLLIFTILMSTNIVSAKYDPSIYHEKAYTIWDHRTTVYTDSTFSTELGYIWGDTELDIGDIVPYKYVSAYYTDEWNRRQLGYLPYNHVFALSGPKFYYKVKEEVTAYRRPKGPEYGHIMKGATIRTKGNLFGYTQVCYPYDLENNAYRYAFVKDEDVEKYMEHINGLGSAPVKKTPTIKKKTPTIKKRVKTGKNRLKTGKNKIRRR